jgi:hypothetical protein
MGKIHRLTNQFAGLFLWNRNKDTADKKSFWIKLYLSQTIKAIKA